MGKKVSLLPRGFKANAEKISLEYRQNMGLKAHDHLCGFELARHLNISVFPASDFFEDPIILQNLVGTPTQDMGWSALTMMTEKGNTIIIHNHIHSPQRQQSNLMHELAHIICEHKEDTSRPNLNLPFFMRSFDPQQEAEAICLGACLQVPRAGLLWAYRKGMKGADISSHFNASVQMVTFRTNDSGVKKQLGSI